MTKISVTERERDAEHTAQTLDDERMKEEVLHVFSNHRSEEQLFKRSDVSGFGDFAAPSESF